MRAARTKAVSIGLLAIAEILAMSLWFVSNAILPDMMAEVPVSATRQALLSSSVQAGFVAGALTIAVSGLADRLDPRRVFVVSALAASGINLVLLVAPIGGSAAIVIRFMTGALMAGIYPVGMKIATGWGQSDRGFLVGLLVGALTLGSAAPHLASYAGGSDWRSAVMVTSALAAMAAVAASFVGLGPHHARAPRFHPGAIALAWSNRQVRLAYAGYLGHMWELYAMWAWIAAAAATSYASTLEPDTATTFAKLTAFLAIAAGGLASIAGGAVADRIGKARFAGLAMLASGSAALVAAATFGGPAWLTFAVAIVWGIAIIPDSAQFSALVADAAPPEAAGSLLTFQTALGFALTIATVQWTPVAAAQFGWPPVLAAMAIGPALGVIAMRRLQRLQETER